MQSRLGSLIEAKANTLTGTAVSYGAGFVVYPAFGHSFDPGQLVWITLIFTGLSIARGYVIRRIGNWLTYRKQKSVL